jgi:hypothetical protein
LAWVAFWFAFFAGICGWLAVTLLGAVWAQGHWTGLLFWGGIGALFLRGTLWLGSMSVRAVSAALLLLTDRRAEQVVLTDTGLLHDPGYFLLSRGKTGSWDDWPTPVRRGRPREMRWNEIDAIRFERGYDSQRLTVDCGAERLEIGSVLAEDERRWVAGMLLDRAPSGQIATSTSSTTRRTPATWRQHS